MMGEGTEADSSVGTMGMGQRYPMRGRFAATKATKGLAEGCEGCCQRPRTNVGGCNGEHAVKAGDVGSRDGEGGEGLKAQMEPQGGSSMSIQSIIFASEPAVPSSGTIGAKFAASRASGTGSRRKRAPSRVWQ
ncbi:hypothetical protein B0H13DRAFT_1899315 [Mycena leptocephala]|nr:hypothetical protein B0H13DRAFT_1899315 [Mycena leptocephala]